MYPYAKRVVVYASDNAIGVDLIHLMDIPAERMAIYAIDQQRDIYGVQFASKRDATGSVKLMMFESVRVEDDQGRPIPHVVRVTFDSYIDRDALSSELPFQLSPAQESLVITEHGTFVIVRVLFRH